MDILYIENHEVFAKTVSKIFLSKHKVKIVPSIIQATKLLEQSQKYNIALIDYDLDDGKGDSLAALIKKNTHT